MPDLVQVYAIRFHIQSSILYARNTQAVSHIIRQLHMSGHIAWVLN